MYTVQYTVYTVHCTVYIVHRTTYTVRCMSYTVRRTVYDIHLTLYIDQYGVYGTLYSVHCTLYIVHCTLLIRHVPHRSHGININILLFIRSPYCLVLLAPPLSSPPTLHIIVIPSRPTPPSNISSNLSYRSLGITPLITRINYTTMCISTTILAYQIT